MKFALSEEIVDISQFSG